MLRGILRYIKPFSLKCQNFSAESVCETPEHLSNKFVKELIGQRLETLANNPKIHIYDTTNSKPVSYSDANFNETEYYFENGLRKVYPYYYTYTAHCKQRWEGKELLKIYEQEFGSFTGVHLTRILEGKLLVNGKKKHPDYVLKSRDVLTSSVHRHESAILSLPLKIIHNDENIIVIDKPPSIPVHPCGLYRHNSVIFLLAKEHNIKRIYIIHRLDRLTSGLVIFPRTVDKARELTQQIINHDVNKAYVCRVEGNFPDSKIMCDLPLKQVRASVGIAMITKNGKPAYTEFEKLHYNGKSSVLLCRPLTGRTHQIRVHLQFLGYPIINDSLYNSYVFGPQKGKNGIIGKSIEDLKVDLCKKYDSSHWIDDDVSFNEAVESNCEISEKINTKDSRKVSFDAGCFYCTHRMKDPSLSKLVMYLHAYKYEGKDWSFQTDLPKWADSNWTES